MKRWKLLLTVFFVLLLSGLFCASAAAESADFTVSVTPFGDESTKIDWWYSFPEDRYYLFLPAGTDFDALTVDYSCASLSVNGKKIKKGKKTRLLEPDAELTVSCGEKSYPLTVLVSENIPAVFIHTGSGSLEKILADKDYKEAGSLTAADNGKLTGTDAPLAYIKGRGNSTWDANGDKKPYNIKFEEKTDLFGMGAAEKWALLANALDPVLIRNAAALTLAERLNVPYAVASQRVDLYINGVYQGNYLLCESVQVGEDRIGIRDLEAENEKADPSADLDLLGSAQTSGDPLAPGSRKWTALSREPADETGGYLLEFDFPDRYADEPCGFISTRGQCVVIKSPKYASKKQVEYIASLYQEMEDAVCGAEGRNADGKHFSDYMDTDSFAAMYLLLEFTMNFDGCSSSFFFTKDAGEAVFRAGPAWDYDLAFRNYRREIYDRALTPDLWIVRENSLILENSRSEENLMTALCRQEAFWKAAQRNWNEALPYLENEYADEVSAIAASNTPSAGLNAVRWGLLSGSGVAEKRQSYLQRCAEITSLIQTRVDSLKAGIPSPDTIRTVAEIDWSAAKQTTPPATDASAQNTGPSVSESGTAVRETTEALPSASGDTASAWIVVSAVGTCAMGAIVLLLCLRRKKAEMDKKGKKTQGEASDDE